MYIHQRSEGTNTEVIHRYSRGRHKEASMLKPFSHKFNDIRAAVRMGSGEREIAINLGHRDLVRTHRFEIALGYEWCKMSTKTTF